MTDTLSHLLSRRDWLLADGATGTNLFNMGLASGDAPELWNTDEPAKVRALYDGSIHAGSDLFLTNSFGGNASRLKLHAAQGRVRELNRISAEIGREAVDASGRAVVVAGSMGPTGDILEPVGTLSHADAVEIFEEAGAGLIEGGADVLWLETLSAEEELRAAAEAMERLGAPWCVTMSFDTAGRTMMGVTSAGLPAIIESFAHKPIAYGANCGVGASDLLRTMLGMSEAAPADTLVAKGNAGIPKYVDGAIHYDGTPDLMAEYAVLARDTGAKIIGGCCGTQPPHLTAMRRALESTPPGPRPGLDRISAALGGFSSESDGVTGGAAPARRERRRRRG